MVGGLSAINSMETTTTERLEQLFRACDTKGTGYIGRQELAELCAGLGIGVVDSDTLFVDLDHDGDERIDFDDFVQGFQDFVSSASAQDDDDEEEPEPSSSMTTVTAGCSDEGVSVTECVDNSNETSSVLGEKAQVLRRRNRPRLKSSGRQSSSNDVWKTVLRHINPESVKSISATKLEELQGVLTSLSSSPKLATCFETVVQSLLQDMQRLQCDNERLEEIYRTEKAKHETHLRQIEEEIDAHVQKVEEKLKEQMRLEAEAEISALKTKMDTEICELQSHLKIFQTFDSLLKKDRNEEDRLNAIRSRLDEAANENRKLRMTLTDTQTNIALLHSELAHLRTQYEDKCRELHSERENSLEYFEDQDHLTRQLHLLQSANRRLQDANDSIRTVMESNENLIAVPSTGSTVNSPPVKKARSMSKLLFKRGSVIGDYMKSTESLALGKPLDKTSCSEIGLQSGLSGCQAKQEMEQNNTDPCGTLINNSNPLQLLDRGGDEFNFGMKRFMEDLDSGLSMTRDPTEIDDEQQLTVASPDMSRRISVMTNGETELESIPLSVTQELADELVTDSPTSGWAVLHVTSPRQSRHPKPDDPSCRRSLRRQSFSVLDTPSKVSLFRSDSTTSNNNNNNNNNNNKNNVNASCVNSNNNNSNTNTNKNNGTLSDDLMNNCFEATGPPDRMYKVVFAGDAAVGKTTFIMRISKGLFVATLMSTLGVDFHVKTLRVDGKNVSLQLWDTAGQERFRSVTKSYFRRADGVMLLYDCTSEHSFLNVRDWMAAIDSVSEKRIPIMLCANKIDLRETAFLRGKSIVRTEDGERLARDFSAIFIETSAKSGKNVIDALIQLTREMSANEDLEVQTSGLRITDLEATKKGVCCGK